MIWSLITKSDSKNQIFWVNPHPLLQQLKKNHAGLMKSRRPRKGPRQDQPYQL